MKTYRRQESPERKIWDPDYLHMYALNASILRYVHMVRGDVLDVGCGNLPYVNWFRDARSYTGIDVDTDGSSPQVRGSAWALPFSDSCFDTAVSFQAFEHFGEPWTAFEEVSRVLRRGGIALITTHQAFHLHGEPYDFFRYTKYGLALLAERAGLEVLEIEHHGGMWAMVGQAMLLSLLGKVPGWAYCYLRPLFVLWNFIFGLLEWYWMDPRDTMNYLIIARKPQEAS